MFISIVKYFLLLLLSFGLLVIPLTLVQAEPSSADTWAIQLHNINPVAIADDDVDLVVIDYAKDGTDKTAFSAAEVAAMQQNGKKVLAYLSIGKAEAWRFYWNSQWEAARQGDCYERYYDYLKYKWTWRNKCVPGNTPLVGNKDPLWDGELYARYWDNRWKTDVVEPYMERIMEAGFDGVYLAHVDAYNYWGAGTLTRRTYAREMQELIITLSSTAKQQSGDDFLVIPENVSGIISASKDVQLNKKFLTAIDAIAERSLVFDTTKAKRGKRITELRTDYSYQKPILVLEFSSSTYAPTLRRWQESFLKKYGLRMSITRSSNNAELDSISEPVK